MTAVLTLLVAGGICYLLRVALVNLLPAGRLPASVQRTLPHVGPAALAALVATEVAQGDPRRIAVVVTAALVARFTGNLAAATLAGFGAALALAAI